MMNACKSTLVTVLLLSAAYAKAQSPRDPTLPPAVAGQAAAAVEGGPATTSGMTIIVRGGHSYLAVGTRLYAQGQKLGQARIERISETEVWLREGGVLRKLPQFSGIERRTAGPTAAKPTCATANPPKPSKSAPCADLQPRGQPQ